ncbi:hypothetical protein [Erwinia sorbitola]|uniref:Uncharacterized protein n=1 Tax=Erwinia sorbitola TaxID=2681984 RepID=A0A6I6EVH7_9GAMM|nr:hypothetical protein [Erwinia sorbitola]MTD27033.1 hypothetical protein [Erwinia sorbitola]QGU88592.1 hypothetical protein GN242_15800 [Erwinia sorbitola]
MTPENLALVAEARSTILKALLDSEHYRNINLNACLQLSEAASHALSLTIKLERGSLADQENYAYLLEMQMVSLRACQGLLNKLTKKVTQ